MDFNAESDVGQEQGDSANLDAFTLHKFSRALDLSSIRPIIALLDVKIEQNTASA